MENYPSDRVNEASKYKLARAQNFYECHDIARLLIPVLAQSPEVGFLRGYNLFDLNYVRADLSLSKIEPVMTASDKSAMKAPAFSDVPHFVADACQRSDSTRMS